MSVGIWLARRKAFFSSLFCPQFFFSLFHFLLSPSSFSCNDLIPVQKTQWGWRRKFCSCPFVSLMAAVLSFSSISCTKDGTQCSRYGLTSVEQRRFSSSLGLKKISWRLGSLCIIEMEMNTFKNIFILNMVPFYTMINITCKRLPASTHQYTNPVPETEESFGCFLCCFS